MSYRVRHGLSYCVCEDRPIFLDVDAGRYFTLPAELCAPFAALMSGDGGVACREIERLLALHVIENGRQVPKALGPLSAPSREVARCPSLRWSAAALLTQGLAIRHVRHLPLRRLFALETARRPVNRAATEEEIGRLRAAFDQVAGIFGEADQCLPRSIAFRRLALSCGQPSSLVIGVKIDPFGAHCWVQSGARLDSDSLERVRLFTPIHVI